MTTMRGTVISVHAHGATIRLEDGTLAAVAPADVAAGRRALATALANRQPLDFAVDLSRRHTVATFAERSEVAGARAPDGAQGEPAERPPPPAGPEPPAETRRPLTDPDFERRMADYLKSTEAWAPADRHLVRKKRRTAFFEARTKPT